MANAIRIDAEQVQEAVKIANTLLDTVDKLQGLHVEAKATGEAQSTLGEVVFGVLRDIENAAMLKSVRNFVAEQYDGGDLDSVTRKVFSYCVGSRESKDLDPSKYALFYGPKGFRAAYDELCEGEESKMLKACAKLLKARPVDFRMGYLKGLHAELTRVIDGPTRDASEVVDAVIAKAKAESAKKEPVPA